MSVTYVFDAALTLGIGTPSADPLPAPEAGFITLRVSDGLTLRALRESGFGRRLIHPQDWYDDYLWKAPGLAGGTYRLRIPVPGSRGKTFAEQQAMLHEGEQVPPAALAAAALLCIRLAGGADPLVDAWIRCVERTADGIRVGLGWVHGRLGVVSELDDDRDYLIVSSLRTS